MRRGETMRVKWVRRCAEGVGDVISLGMAKGWLCWRIEGTRFFS